MKTTLQRIVLALAVLALQALPPTSDADDAGQGPPDAFTPDGGRYFGPLVNGRMHGRGRLDSATGSVYEGEFREGMYWGNGRFTHPTGYIYEGNFVRGSLEGTGKVTSRGSVYEGEIKQWQYHGRGVLRHANGDVYEGRFEHGLYNGQGTLKYAKPRPDGQTEESGVWRYGRLFNQDEFRKVLTHVETAIYEQKSLLDRALASLKDGEPGRIDMYLLTVAGDGSQEVFRREVDFVEKTFGERFGTAGRSVALVNSRNTLDSAPMATVTSIRAALQAIGARMNREEDILFLFLTSHGSREHELVLNQAGMQLRGLRAAELGTLLKESGIRWKVVLVSACYSGGFIDALRDPGTLVITAARRDRSSFGCADENDFTYFGRAFFKESLPEAQSFQQAFSKASRLVNEWERKDAGAKDENHSLPQIDSPKAIEAQLRRWWDALPASR